METSRNGDRSLKHIAEQMLDQTKAVGQFGLGSGTTKEILQTGLADRVAFIRSFYQCLEEAVDLRFSKNEMPFLYNTADWPDAEAPGGYVAPERSPRPSQIIATYLGNWILEWNEQYVTARILRAALWICHQNGMRPALRYLLDLQKAGFVLDPDSFLAAINMIAIARDHCASDADVPKVFFGDELPSDPAAWSRATFVEVGYDGESSGRSLINAFLEECLDEAERVRNSTSYDEWMLGQWQLAALTLQWSLLFAGLGTNVPSTLKAIDDQLVEIRCDANGIQLLYQTVHLRDCFRANFAMAGAAKLIRHKCPNDWRDRVLNERVMVPRRLAAHLLENGRMARGDGGTPEWEGLSPKISPMFSSVVKGKRFWSCWRLNPFPNETIVHVAEIQELLQKNNVVDPTEQIANIEYHYLGTMTHLHGLLAGGPGLRLVDDEELSRLVDEAHIKLCAQEIESVVNKAMQLWEQDRRTFAIEALENLVRTYPWSEIVHSELGIALDKSGQHENALRHLETAILVNPLQQSYWQSLAVILHNLGHIEEAQIVNAIQMTIVRRKHT